MNKRALYTGLIYSLLVIAFKLYILLGGYTFTRFGFYFSNLAASLAIIPFIFIAVWMVRTKDYQGFIGGRESVRIGFTIIATSMLIVSAYNYLEFVVRFKDLAVEYYHGEEYLRWLSEQQVLHPDKLKTADFPRIIEEQVKELSAFKATTGKLMPVLVFGMAGAFMAAVTLRRRQVQPSQN